jgi:hypothetical protein
MAEAGRQTVREAVGVFHDRDSFSNAVEDLMSAALPRHNGAASRPGPDHRSMVRHSLARA